MTGNIRIGSCPPEPTETLKSHRPKLDPDTWLAIAGRGLLKERHQAGRAFAEQLMRVDDLQLQRA